MDTDATRAGALSVAASPAGDHAYWETENRMVWNEQQHTSEERELVYEISWILDSAHGGVFCDRQKSQRENRIAMIHMDKGNAREIVAKQGNPQL